MDTPQSALAAGREPLSGGDAVALREIAAYREDGWITPLRCGVDSYRLTKLCKKGFAERKQRGASDEQIGLGPRVVGMSRGSWCYRITDAGLDYLRSQP